MGAILSCFDSKEDEIKSEINELKSKLTELRYEHNKLYIDFRMASSTMMGYD